jgi:glycosyltransferase involved in cell wall biosynthesis|tara:strand:+ start:1916 stop:3007 length:1092 start_codon:yes stop_codon:yes gene_type:complete
MKKILVADWLDKYGGAERVLTVLNRQYDFEKCYTLINIMSNNDLAKVFQDKQVQIIESNLKFLKSNFRYLFFLFPYFISKFENDKDNKLIISSSFSVAKGFKKKTGQIHICYYQARNQRYIWDNEKIYFSSWQRLILTPLLKLLRHIDINHSKRPDYIIANSHFVKNWIKKTYNIDSKVIYPPVDTNLFKLVKEKKDYFITTARLEPYKRVDLLVKAFNRSKETLYVVGDGSMKNRLKKISNSNIKFFDFLEPSEVMKLVSKAKAFVHAGIEDFGIAPVEAQSTGTPVIAYNMGGLSETVVEGKTGVFFNSQSVDAILEALIRFKKIEFDYEAISIHADQFSEKNFATNIRNYIDLKLKEKVF